MTKTRIIFLRVLVAVALLGAGAAFLWVQQLLYVGSANGDPVEVRIERGSSILQIGSQLEDTGVIAHAGLFQFYVSTSGMGSSLQAGLYSFNEGQSIASIVEVLTRGDVLRDRFRFSLPEGSNIQQVAEGAERQGFCSSEAFLEAVERSRLRQAEPGVIYALEGYLYPATYTFDALPTPDELILTFYTKAQEVYEDLEIPEDCPLTLEEVIILASVLEKESQHEDERANVASVFINRLAIDMPLQSCASVQYILPEFKAVLSEADTLIDSPYNTYVNGGLPVGPISNPSLPALEAVLNPAETDYLFFVADADGTHIFTRTYEEHLEAIASIED